MRPAVKKAARTAEQLLLLAAPHTWAAAVVPSLLSAVLAYADTKRLDLPMAALVLLACILMQSAANALNDYNDFLKGTDTVENSPDRRDAVIVYGLSPKTALTAGLAFLLAAAAIGAYICAARGPAPLLIGLLGAAALAWYVSGSRPASYLPVGGAALRIRDGRAYPAGRVLRADGPAQAEPPAGDPARGPGHSAHHAHEQRLRYSKRLDRGQKDAALPAGREADPQAVQVGAGALGGLARADHACKGRTGRRGRERRGHCVLSGALARQFRLSLGPVARAAAMRGIVRLNALIGLVYGLALLTEVWL